MKSCIWRFAGVSLLCFSVSAQALAEGEADEDRQRLQEQHQKEQHQQEQHQQQEHQVQQQQQQQQEQQRQQQFQQQRQQQVQQQEQQRQQQFQQQQHQQQVQQQQEQQRQLQQQQTQQQRLPIQPRPDEVWQTQQPRQGYYQDNPRQASNQNSHWQGRPDGHGNGWGSGPRYHPGYVIDRMPSEHSRYGWHGQDYFYSDGYWYRPQGPRYVIVQPPRGIRVHDLPSYSQEVWLGGALFFVAAGTYYMYQQDTQDYVVTEPPQGVEPVYPAGPPEAAPVQAPPFNISYDPRFSPVNGQGQDQMNQDGYDCHMYAIDQSHFDPSTAAYAPSQQVVDFYRQTMSNCLASRGYSISY